jgi:hypothetical protein
LHRGLFAQAPKILNFLVAPFSAAAQNLYAAINAFIADEHFWARYQRFQLVLALPAKRAVMFGLFAHDRSLAQA